MLIPVIRDLQRRGGRDIVVLGATAAGPELRAAGIAAVGYRDLLRSGEDAALRYGRQLLADSHDPRTGIDQQESIAYLGLSFQDLVERLGEAEARESYARHKRHAFLQIGPMRRAIERWHPDVVVATTSPKSERAALLVAKDAGIGTVRIEDTLGLHPRIHPAFVPDVVADVVCVGSTIAARNVIARGVPEDHVRLTGNPAFDRLVEVDPGAGRALRAAVGIPASGFLALFTAEEDEHPALGALFEAVGSAIPGARLAVRRHPNFRHADSDAYLGSLRGRCLLMDTEPLDAVLTAADAVLSVTSTTMFESILLGRPVVQLGAETGVYDPALLNVEDVPLHRYGATLLASDPRSLSDALLRAASEGAALAARARSLFVAPGDASRRVGDEIVRAGDSYSRT
jgi:hypothetical protein